MAKTIHVINGPNLNLLGTREPEIYGSETLADVETRLVSEAKALGLVLQAKQSNSEGQLVDWIQQAGREAAGVLLNPGAYTHTSVALRDAVSALGIPLIEIHISNIYARESFRHHSYVSAVATAVICGCGTKGYSLGLVRLAEIV